MTLCWQNQRFYAANVVHTLGHTGTQPSPDGEGGSFSGSKLDSSSSPSSNRSASPADEPLFAEAEKGGRPDSGTAAASDLKTSVGAA